MSVPSDWVFTEHELAPSFDDSIMSADLASTTFNMRDALSALPLCEEVVVTDSFVDYKEDEFNPAEYEHLSLIAQSSELNHLQSFDNILYAPTASITRLDEASLTYLNQGQLYDLKLSYTGDGEAIQIKVDHYDGESGRHLEAYSGQIKVFKLKGADRRHKTDQEILHRKSSESTTTVYQQSQPFTRLTPFTCTVVAPNANKSCPNDLATDLGRQPSTSSTSLPIMVDNELQKVSTPDLTRIKISDQCSLSPPTLPNPDFCITANKTPRLSLSATTTESSSLVPHSTSTGTTIAADVNISLFVDNNMRRSPSPRRVRKPSLSGPCTAQSRRRRHRVNDSSSAATSSSMLIAAAASQGNACSLSSSSQLRALRRMLNPSSHYGHHHRPQHRNVRSSGGLDNVVASLSGCGWPEKRRAVGSRDFDWVRDRIPLKLDRLAKSSTSARQQTNLSSLTSQPTVTSLPHVDNSPQRFARNIILPSSSAVSPERTSTAVVVDDNRQQHRQADDHLGASSSTSRSSSLGRSTSRSTSPASLSSSIDRSDARGISSLSRTKQPTDGDSCNSQSPLDDPPTLRLTVSADSTSSQIVAWLQASGFSSISDQFGSFTGRDLLRLTKDDFITLCGLTEGLRLHNAIYDKPPKPRCTLYIGRDERTVFHALLLYALTKDELLQHLALQLNLSVDSISLLCIVTRSGVPVMITDELVKQLEDQSCYQFQTVADGPRKVQVFLKPVP